MNIIIVKQPPVVLKPTEHQSEQEALEIAITKLLLKSYYNIVRKNVEDFIPKAIMHFLVCNLYLSCIHYFYCQVWSKYQ
jgi:dynamin 1-like protein